MRERLEQLMVRYGQSATLTRCSTGERLDVHAFLQPVRRQQAHRPAATPLGAVSRQRWLYIGPAEKMPAPGDRLEVQGVRLTAKEVQTVWWQDEPLYCRAALCREKEAED